MFPRQDEKKPGEKTEPDDQNKEPDNTVLDLAEIRDEEERQQKAAREKVAEEEKKRELAKLLVRRGKQRLIVTAGTSMTTTSPTTTTTTAPTTTTTTTSPGATTTTTTATPTTTTTTTTPTTTTPTSTRRQQKEEEDEESESLVDDSAEETRGNKAVSTSSTTSTSTTRRRHQDQDEEEEEEQFDEEARALKEWTEAWDTELRLILQNTDEPAVKLQKAAEVKPEISKSLSAGSKRALQDFRVSMAKTVPSVFGAGASLVIPPTTEESEALEAYLRVRKQRDEYTDKIAQHLQEASKAKTTAGAGHEKSRAQHYQQLKDQLPVMDDRFIQNAEKLRLNRKDKLRKEKVLPLVAEVKASLDNVFRVAGGKQKLNLKEGVDPIESLIVMIVLYVDSLEN